jgi:hypothetical protein
VPGLVGIPRETPKLLTFDFKCRAEPVPVREVFLDERKH